MTPVDISPLERPSVPWNIIQVPLHQVKCTINWPSVYNFRNCTINSCKCWTLAEPLKYVDSATALSVITKISEPLFINPFVIKRFSLVTKFAASQKFKLFFWWLQMSNFQILRVQFCYSAPNTWTQTRSHLRPQYNRLHYLPKPAKLSWVVLIKLSILTML